MEGNSFVNTFRSRLNRVGVELLDDFIRNIKNVKESRIEIELAAKQLEAKYPAHPIRFINFNDFASLGRLPRYPDNADITCSLDSIDRDSSLLVFISHCWLRGHPGTKGWDGKAHPDNVNHDKYKICVEGIERMKSNLANKSRNCFVWLDFGCMNQDDKDLMREELEHYDRVIQCCDCLFTPIVDPDHEGWNYGITETNYLQNYRAISWNIGPDAYLNRAWCRVEMMYAAVLPVLLDYDSAVERHTLFEGGLAYHCSQHRRPHYLFGTKELRLVGPPLLLSPLLYSYFDEYHPLSGALSVPSDIEFIRMMIVELTGFIIAKKIEPGYNGDMNDVGQRHGQGVIVYDNGDVYNGEWKNDKRCGHGHFRSANGDEYDGEWKDDEKHGQGRLTVSVGVYEGELASGHPCGQGTMKFHDGQVVTGSWRDGHVDGEATLHSAFGMYEGEWKAGMLNGHGTFRYASGSVYEGELKNDKKHGYGIFRYADGDVYEGELKDDMMHGQGTFRYADGDVYEGKWENNKKHGHGTLQFAYGVVYDGEWMDDAMNGHGMLRYDNGDMYEGEWLNNKKHGHGILRYADGGMFEGEWKDDKQHGQGTFR